MPYTLRSRAALAAACIALFAVACDDDDATGPSTDTIASSIQTDAHIVAVAHESNLGEIQAGTLAQQRAADTEVRAFATMMVTDHTLLDQQGNALAAQLGIAPVLPDSALPRVQQRELADLSTAAAASGTGGTAATSFDRAYIAQQVTAHQRTLALVDASIARAQRAELRTALQNQVRPAVASHLQMAQQIRQRIGQ